MMRLLLLCLAATTASACARAEPACRKAEHDGARYAVCVFAPGADIRLFLDDAAGAPYGEFDALKAALEARGETLRFAMNAGMYTEARRPVGLYVEAGETRRGINRADCAGNFCLKPNGVFWIDAEGAAHVATTDAFSEAAAGESARYATQSGPMLVIDGALHPRFSAASESRKYRNGVGVREDGAVVFVLTDEPVTFHAFATLFRDGLGARNALYLDGSISRLYAPELDRDDAGEAMGPIVAVVAPPEKGRP